MNATSTSRAWFAHSGRDAHGQPTPTSEWHLLKDHLLGVATRAADFASPFGGLEWARAAGLWHDLGKYSEAFQRYLETSASGDYHGVELRGSVDHTSAGAQHAAESTPILGALLAYVIAGHHAGLLDAVSDGACLDARLKKRVETWKHGLDEIPRLQPLMPPELLTRAFDRRSAGDPQQAAFSAAFFTRMLFSCLVDADFLDTELHLNREQAQQRHEWPPETLARMDEALTSFVDSFGPPTGAVDEQRDLVRTACIEAAPGNPGLFSLTVPTGGGKTLSSLAFALRHAQLHGLRRIVYVVPFTTIIEQNADVFRRVFRPLEGIVADPVLEHHSALDPDSETSESRLACENWDAPLVVTTSVQFFESLFACRTGRCRKLHNLARAVIILDEAQKIPVQFLAPCLAALRELASSYDTSVVLCTATQPAINRRPDFQIGLEGVREIMPEPRTLYLALKRVDVEHLGALSDEATATRLREATQVLCVVNTRRHARELFERLRNEDGAVHLSAAMCPEHRTEVLDSIRGRLEQGQPCRVISTQLVEAGVDLDFPVVYRSLAGLDSIAQAAGRCNRNGRMGSARTFVFRSEHQEAEVFLRDTTNVTAQLLGNDSVPPLYDDLLSLEAVEHYFRLYYWSQKERWDQHGILDGTQLQGHVPSQPFKFDFAEIASKFHLIADTGAVVIVPWGERGASLCEQLRAPWSVRDRKLLRALQRFTVQVHRRVYNRQLGCAVELLHDRFPVLSSPELYYDDELGLVLDKEDFASGTFII